MKQRLKKFKNNYNRKMLSKKEIKIRLNNQINPITTKQKTNKKLQAQADYAKATTIIKQNKLHFCFYLKITTRPLTQNPNRSLIKV